MLPCYLTQIVTVTITMITIITILIIIILNESGRTCQTEHSASLLSNEDSSLFLVPSLQLFCTKVRIIFVGVFQKIGTVRFGQLAFTLGCVLFLMVIIKLERSVSSWCSPSRGTTSLPTTTEVTNCLVKSAAGRLHVCTGYNA